MGPWGCMTGRNMSPLRESGVGLKGPTGDSNPGAARSLSGCHPQPHQQPAAGSLGDPSQSRAESTKGCPHQQAKRDGDECAVLPQHMALLAQTVSPPGFATLTLCKQTASLYRVQIPQHAAQTLQQTQAVCTGSSRLACAAATDGSRVAQSQAPVWQMSRFRAARVAINFGPCAKGEHSGLKCAEICSSGSMGLELGVRLGHGSGPMKPWDVPGPPVLSRTGALLTCGAQVLWAATEEARVVQTGGGSGKTSLLLAAP